MKSGTHIFTIHRSSVTVVVFTVKWWLWYGACAVLWRRISILTDFMLPTVSNRKQPIWQQKFEQTRNSRWNCVLNRLPNLNFRVCVHFPQRDVTSNAHSYSNWCMQDECSFESRIKSHWMYTTQRRKSTEIQQCHWIIVIICSSGATFETWFIETCCIITEISTKVILFFVSNSPFRYLIIQYVFSLFSSHLPSSEICARCRIHSILNCDLAMRNATYYLILIIYCAFFSLFFQRA